MRDDRSLERGSRAHFEIVGSVRWQSSSFQRVNDDFIRDILEYL